MCLQYTTDLEFRNSVHLRRSRSEGLYFVSPSDLEEVASNSNILQSFEISEQVPSLGTIKPFLQRMGFLWLPSSETVFVLVNELPFQGKLHILLILPHSRFHFQKSEYLCTADSQGFTPDFSRHLQTSVIWLVCLTWLKFAAEKPKCQKIQWILFLLVKV